jgi:thiamine-monophosphate kinase
LRYAEREFLMTLREIGEFGLIPQIREWMTAKAPSLIRTIGEDVAVIDMGREALLITTDILIEDIHFERSWTDPYRLGKKALSVNLSDIAAMGGTPTYFLISLGLPKQLSLSFVSSLYRGLKEVAKQFRIDLIGGDTSLSQKIIINICLLGRGKKNRLLFRSGANAGDDLFVSGTLGDASLGLKILQKEGLRGKPKGLIEKHLSPLPRVELGQILATSRMATAMIDVSDGLLIDTSHLLEESHRGARIWEDRIPLSRLYRKWISSHSKVSRSIALYGGEDYELLFSAPPGRRRKIEALSLSLNIPLTCIGKLLPAKDGFYVIRKNGEEYAPHRLGYDHFT